MQNSNTNTRNAKIGRITWRTLALFSTVIYIVLSTVFEESKEAAKETELNCSIIDIIDNNYTLSCEGAKNVNYSLQNSMSFIKNEILLISFDKDEDGYLVYNTSENKKSFPRLFFSKKNGKINTGGIVAIILAFVAVVVFLLFTFKCLRKKKNEIQNKTESTIISLKK